VDARVVGYLAREAVRRYGAIEPRLPEKLQRNVRRNFAVTIPREDVLSIVEHYKRVYGFGASILPRYLTPARGRYADPSDVRVPAFTLALRKRYPRERRAVLDLVAWYVVFYEYLK
jgi:hypothetical protein